jgi:hypothetical protein
VNWRAFTTSCGILFGLSEAKPSIFIDFRQHGTHSLGMSAALSIAVLGCGSRGRTYSRIIASLPRRHRLTAAVDHHATRRETVSSLGPAGKIRGFDSVESFFAARKLADVLIIATQDSQHFDHAIRALDLGYDLLLEKPSAESLRRLRFQASATVHGSARNTRRRSSRPLHRGVPRCEKLPL